MEASPRRDVERPAVASEPIPEEPQPRPAPPKLVALPRGWRDWREPLLWCLAFPGLLVGAMSLAALISFPHASSIWMVAAVSLFVGGAAALRIVKLRGQPDLLPGLDSIAPGAPVYERGAVQFTAMISGAKARRGETAIITFLFQNCSSQPRGLYIALDDQSASVGGLFYAGGIPGYRFVAEHRHSIGPGEIAELTVPVAIEPSVESPLQLWIRFFVKGQFGRRVRHRRAREFHDQVSAASQVLGAAMGHIHVGGGMSFRIEPAEGKPVITEEKRRLKPSWRILHSPDAELLSRV